MEGFSKKLALAFMIKEEIKRVFLKNREFSCHLERLKESINRSKEVRNFTGLSGLCGLCGSQKRDCCGRGIELRYSAELLALNLFFGVDIPSVRRLPDSCYFLSEKGCILFVRDIFCINFICDRIRDSIPFENLKKLWQIEGIETENIFKTTEFLKKHIKIQNLQTTCHSDTSL